MASGPDIIQLGHDLTTVKLYSVSTAALWAYDYLLTVGDEVRYAWKTENVLMFSLFLFARYVPIPFLIWVNITSFYPGYTKICKKTAFLEAVYYTAISAAAQLVLTQRSYAITGKNKWIAGILYAFSGMQLVLGLYVIVHVAVDRGVIPAIPLPLYQLCVIDLEPFLTFTQTSLFLAFDVVVFVLVIIQLLYAKSSHRGVRVPSILETVGRDAGVYFAVIASSHLLVLVFFAVARPGMRGMGIEGLAVFIPVMINRMVISLKKAASKRHPLSLETPGSFSTGLHDDYSAHAVNGIPLSPLKTGRV